MGAFKIPEELLEQADQVPGLEKRVARFIKLEVTQFEIRQKRFHPETLAIVARAKASADHQRAAGADLQEKQQTFLEQLNEMKLR